jgi:uncharacterized BrkB/YihY/UPF0761 family membrane protein
MTVVMFISLIIINIITFVTEIFSMIKVEAKGSVTAWNIFVGTLPVCYITNLAFMLCFIGANNNPGTWDMLGAIIYAVPFCGIPIIINLVLTVIGVRIKDKRNDPKIKLNVYFLVTLLMEAIITVILLVEIPLVLNIYAR